MRQHFRQSARIQLLYGVLYLGYLKNEISDFGTNQIIEANTSLGRRQKALSLINHRDRLLPSLNTNSLSLFLLFFGHFCNLISCELLFCVDKIAVCNSCNNCLGYFWLLFSTTFWLVLFNSLAIKFSCTWQPCLSQHVPLSILGCLRLLHCDVWSR